MGFSEILSTIDRVSSSKMITIPGQPSNIPNPQQPGRRIIGHYHRKSMNLIQPKQNNSIDSSSRVKTLEYPRKEHLQHSLSYSGLHPAASAGGILFQGNNQSNSADQSFSINNNLCNNSLLNIESSRQRVQQFLMQNDEKPLGVSLSNKQIYQAHSPYRLKSLQVYNTPMLAGMDSINQQISPGISSRSIKNLKQNASAQLLSSPMTRFVQPTQSQLKGINSNHHGMQIPSSLQSLSILQRSLNSSFMMSGNTSRIKGSGLTASPQGGSSPKRSFYHHSDILSVKQFGNLKDNFLKDKSYEKIASDTNENQRKALIKQFRQKVDQFIRFSKLRKNQTDKEFNQFYDKIKDTIFQENTLKKSNNSSSNNNSISLANNSVSFGNSNNYSNLENSNIFQEYSDVSLSGIQPNAEGNKSLLNLEASRFNYSKQSKKFPSILDSINAEIYMEDQFGKQICSTRPIDQRQLQDLLLDKLKRLLTNEDTYTQKIDMITEEYEKVLQRIQTKTFKLKVPYYYEPLMQPFNDFYQIDLEKKRMYELKERDLDGQLLEQVLEEEERNLSKTVPEGFLKKDNESDDDQVDEVQEIYEEEIIETEEELKKEQLEEDKIEIIESTQVQLTQENEANTKGLDHKKVVRQVVKVIKKKKKEKQSYHTQENDEEEEDDDYDFRISRQRRPKQEGGVTPNKSPIQKRRRVTRERTAIEEYLTYRPPSAKPKKINQMNLPVYVPPSFQDERIRKQVEIANEQEIITEKEEQIQDKQRDEQMIPVRNKSPRKKRDQNQQFALSAGASLQVSCQEREQTPEDGSEDNGESVKQNNEESSKIISVKNTVPEEDDEEVAFEFVEQEEEVEYKNIESEQKQEEDSEEQSQQKDQESKQKDQESQISENNLAGVKQAIKLKRYTNNNNLPQTKISDKPTELYNVQQAQKKKVGTYLIDELIKFQYLLDFEVDKFKIKMKAPECPKDLEFEDSEDRRLFDQLFQWQFEVEMDIEETAQYLHTAREKNLKKKKKQHDDSDDDEDDPEREQMHRGVSGADKNSIHSSEITDFGPAAPFRESLNDIGSDIFSGLE